MLSKKLKNIVITIFVIFWTLLFHYESTRVFYLNPIFQRDLPKTPLLFPPAGWIMFYNVDERYGFAEVYGVKDNHPQLIDPHLILPTRDICYDNVHRNVLSAVLSEQAKRPFCGYLRRKFPYFDKFFVTYVGYPSLDQEPLRRVQQLMYVCE